MKNLFKSMKLSYSNLDSATRVFLIAFFVSAFSYCLFLSFRGFGWDGDSFESASQFIRLINPKIYGVLDTGTQPKLLTILLFGLMYKLFNGFYILTFISISLNALMVGYLCKWIHSLKGYWQVLLLGMLIQINWSSIVLNCDNPAFNIPFIVVGLYYYFCKNNRNLGIILILIAGLFRPNVDLIFFFIVFWEIRNRRKISSLLLPVIVVSLAHTLFGYRLAFATKELFLQKCFYNFPNFPQDVIKYRFSIRAFELYLKILILLLISPLNRFFLVFSLFGLFSSLKSRKNILFILLIWSVSLIYPLGSLLIGIAHITLSKIMEISIILFAFASFFSFERPRAFLRLDIKVVRVFILLIFTAALVFNVAMGKLLQGKYQVNPVDGSGSSGWKQELLVRRIIEKEFPRDKYYSALISNNLTFFILDNGHRAKKIINFSDFNVIDFSEFDLILLPKDFLFSEIKLDSLGFKKFKVDFDRVLYLKS